MLLWNHKPVQFPNVTWSHRFVKQMLTLLLLLHCCCCCCIVVVVVVVATAAQQLAGCWDCCSSTQEICRQS
jgi:hypothetical protein